MKKVWFGLGALLALIGLTIGVRLWLDSVKQHKRAELSMRRLALSLAVNKEKWPQMIEWEEERQEQLKDARQEAGKDNQAFIQKAKEINSRFHRRFEPLLDSVQKANYTRYRQAAALKKARRMQMKQLLKKKGIGGR